MANNVLFALQTKFFSDRPEKLFVLWYGFSDYNIEKGDFLFVDDEVGGIGQGLEIVECLEILTNEGIENKPSPIHIHITHITVKYGAMQSFSLVLRVHNHSGVFDKLHLFHGISAIFDNLTFIANAFNALDDGISIWRILHEYQSEGYILNDILLVEYPIFKPRNIRRCRRLYLGSGRTHQGCLLRLLSLVSREDGAIKNNWFFTSGTFYPNGFFGSEFLDASQHFWAEFQLLGARMTFRDHFFLLVTSVSK